jgi:hypothetical protein
MIALSRVLVHGLAVLAFFLAVCNLVTCNTGDLLEEDATLSVQQDGV